MDGESCRLIDNQQMIVLIKDRNRDIFRCQIDGFRQRLSENDDVPRAHKVPRPAAFAVASNQTGLNQALDPGTGKARDSPGKKNVNSLPGVRWLYFEALSLRCIHSSAGRTYRPGPIKRTEAVSTVGGLRIGRGLGGKGNADTPTRPYADTIFTAPQSSQL